MRGLNILDSSENGCNRLRPPAVPTFIQPGRAAGLVGYSLENPHVLPGCRLEDHLVWELLDTANHLADYLFCPAGFTASQSKSASSAWTSPICITPLVAGKSRHLAAPSAAPHR